MKTHCPNGSIFSKLSLPTTRRGADRLKSLVTTSSLALLLSLPANAWAQGRVVTISEVTIVGRVQKPIAAVDVSRIQPRLTLAELRQTFTDRIERALYRAPF